jgi:hypothetical protein
MRSETCVTLAAALALLSGLAATGATEAEPSVVLVVPSRYAFVKIAQDIATLRPITVVSYSSTNAASMFLWDSKTAKWSPLDAAVFASGTGFDASSRMIVMGTDATTVNMFASSAKAWATKTTSLPKFDLVAALNAANENLHFSKDEWKWLSELYNLSFKDENEQRRRYGKYGDPKQGKKAPPTNAPHTSADDVVLPESVPATVPVAPADVAVPASPAKTPKDGQDK